MDRTETISRICFVSVVFLKSPDLVLGQPTLCNNFIIGMLYSSPIFFAFFFESKVEKVSCVNVIFPKPVDRFKKFKQRLEAEKILHDLY